MRRSELKKRLRAVAGLVVGTCLVGYFTYHTVHGNHGLIARAHLTAEIDQARTTLAELRSEREVMERHADQLNPRHIDLDLLDERARHMLNLAEPNDVILYLE